jgi:diacylglycerol kinase family enzyme
MKERKIIYLINPISGTRAKSSLQELITKKTREAGIEFSIRPTDAAGNYDFLIPVIEKEKVTDIVICGGDGTVSAVAAALTGRDIRIGIIPMGSGNGLAFAAGIPKDPAQALDILFAGKDSFIDAFLINEKFSCMLCGIGFDAEVAHHFAREPRRGLQTYIKVSLSHFFKARSYRFDIDLSPAAGAPGAGGVPAGVPGSGAPNPIFPVEAFFINIANGNQFGNNVTIAPKADLHDGLLDIVIIKKGGRLQMMLSAIRQVLGGYKLTAHPGDAGTKNALYFQVPALAINNPEGAPLHIDGDPAPSAGIFRIRVIPRAIRLIQP